MTLANLAALGAALSWAVASLFATSAVRALGGIAFTRIRMAFVFILLLLWLAFNGASPIASGDWPLLLLSGFVGIFIGDTALFVTLARLGPRRTAILFSTNAPMTVLLAWLFLGERLTGPAIVGCVLVAAGVTIAIFNRKPRHQRNTWESVTGPLWMGVGIGLLAALGQSIGSLLAKPVLEHGSDAVTVATVRIGAALCALYVIRWIFPAKTQAMATMTWPIAWRVAVSGIIGMAVGMTLLLFAFAEGSVGLSAALSSTTPAMMVPLVWLVSRERPAAGAWLGAALAVAGCMLIVLARG